VGASLRFVHLLTLGLWLGSVVFFSLIVAPTLFATLGREAAGRAVSAIFPRYYGLGGVCGILALLSGLLLRTLGAVRGRLFLVEMILLAAMTGIVAYSGRVLLPQATQARAALSEASGTPAHDGARARFDALHRRSVALNGTVLLLGATAFALAVAQRPPR
jgi:uncharacterized membrane protein